MRDVIAFPKTQKADLMTSARPGVKKQLESCSFSEADLRGIVATPATTDQRPPGDGDAIAPPAERSSKPGDSEMLAADFEAEPAMPSRAA